MLNTEAVYSDPDCVQILMVLMQCENFSLVDIELWVRMVAWQYFTSEEDQENIDYFKEVADPDHRNKTFFGFYALGLIRFGPGERQIICRPLRVVERWEASLREEKIEQAAEKVEALRIKITKKDEETADLVAA